MSEREDLKPCPFCGSSDVRNVSGNYAGPSNRLHEGDEIFAINCGKCGASVPNRYRNGLVIAAWNTRAQPHSRQEGEISEPLGYVDTELLRRYLADKHVKGRPIGPKFFCADGIDDATGMTPLYASPQERPAGGASNADSGSPPPQPQGEPVAWRFRTFVPDYEGQWNVSVGHPSNFVRGREQEVQIEALCPCASPPAQLTQHALDKYEPCLSVGRCGWNEQAVPERWVLVPMEPPQEMLDAWTRKSMLRASVRECYQAMLSAAPQPAPKREGEG